MRVTVALVFTLLQGVVHSIDNGLARTPPMGWNSWNCYGSGISAAALKATADFFVDSGLSALGYENVATDDGWMTTSRDAQGRMIPDPIKFPDGFAAVADYVHQKKLLMGIYSAGSSVVCSGRTGSLYNEVIDAETFASWGVDYVKFDNCGEYGLGLARFINFADAANATGRPMVISSEPFSLHPTPAHREFAHLWRTTNDINANFKTILDRADTNDKWADLAAPGSWNDPDMLEIGNNGLTDGESRVQFGLWSAMKSPLILGTNLSKLSPTQLAIVSNAAVIAVNQDAAGVQAKKLVVDGAPTPRFVGLAPCDAGAEKGFNGVSSASLAWHPQPSAVNTSAVMLVNDETGRCLAIGPYFTYATAPLLLPCNASDATQAWLLPTGAQRLGALLSLPAVMQGAPAALAVGESTLHSAIHGKDTIAVADTNYALTNISLAPYAPEAPCNNRGCDDYAIEQNWYWSPRTKKLSLGAFAANNYRCFGPNCYVLTGHVPTATSWCLAHVLSFDGNVGTDPNGSQNPGSDVWGGPLAGGDYVMVLVNRNNPGTVSIRADWAALEVPGVGAGTTFCVKELFAGTAYGAQVGGLALNVSANDAAVLRLSNAPC